MLSNFETQVNNAKGELLRRLLASIGQEDFKFDQLSAIISAEKPVVLEGDEYKANVVLGAYDSKANPKIVINGAPATVKDGKAEYKVRASGQGNKKIAGYIEVMKEGKPMQYKFETEYQVFKGSATISADKMNVVYIGLDNPISVSVPGFPPSALQVSCTGASLTGSAGKYVLKPVDNKDVKECVIKVSVKDGNKVSTMGQASYRIKMVPAPKVKLGTLEGGKKSKVELSVQNVLAAVLENFVFEGVKWDVTEYSYYYVSKAGGSSGFKEAKIPGKVIDAALKNYISTGRAGDVISFNQIRTVGPGGAARTIQQGPTFILQ
jgi:gliding motility-associated protein GldM